MQKAAQTLAWGTSRKNVTVEQRNMTAGESCRGPPPAHAVQARRRRAQCADPRSISVLTHFRLELSVMLNVAGVNNPAIMAHAYRTGTKSLGKKQAALEPYDRVEPFRTVLYYEILAEKLTSQVQGRDRIVQEIQDEAAMYNIHLGTPETGTWCLSLCLRSVAAYRRRDGADRLIACRGQLSGSAQGRE